MRMLAVSSPPSVVVVDDEAAFGRSLVLLLESRGQPAIGVTSAFDALEAMGDGLAVGLVLVDVRMPEIDGCDFVRAMGYLFPEVSCALMSAYPANDEDLPPGVPFLEKPFVVDDVLGLLASRPPR